jgi:DNA (cytosine-5)-methyltransferase 1
MLMTGIEHQSKNFRVASLFAGCGGMDLGFIGDFVSLGKHYEKNPFDIVWANEINPAACRTYSKNFAHPIINGDIYDHLQSVPEDCDVVIGGFPCQDISVNGLGAGFSGKRSSLYKAMVEVIDRVRPKVFVAENVKGLLMRHHADALKQLVEDFESLGYIVEYKLYNSADYGVAQTRERVFIVGRLPTVSNFKAPTATHDKSKHVSAFSAIDDLANKSEDANFSHIWSKAQRSKDQGSRMLSASRPGYTIRAECHGNIQWHYSIERRISMREAARIQSFPDNFLFDAKLRETERQIGNAVPPVLAWHVARSLAEALS